MEKYAVISHDDATWILTCSFTVFTMQSGFGLLESGAVSAKNEVNVMVKNVVDVIFGGATYWAFGYALSFGDGYLSNPFCGWGQFFPDGLGDKGGQRLVNFFFQASYATTATTIVSGAMAERTKLEAYSLFSALNTLIFAIPAHWVWSPMGWLAQRGVIDCAGAGPVHIVGGMTGLVAAMVLRPREGRYEMNCSWKEGRLREKPPMGSPINSMLGLFLLWWGWLGFNAGSTYGISNMRWKLAVRAAISTIIASTGGAISGMILSYTLKKRRFDIFHLINGVLSAMVAVTAICAYAEPWEAMIIGIIGAILGLLGNDLLDRLEVDDPIGCVGVHAIGGVWGMLAVGLFARGQVGDQVLIPTGKVGLFHGGGWTLLGYQTMALFCIASWALIVSFLLLKLIDITLGLRVSPKEEALGSDIVEHGVRGFVYDKRSKELGSFGVRGFPLPVSSYHCYSPPSQFAGLRERRLNRETIHPCDEGINHAQETTEVQDLQESEEQEVPPDDEIVNTGEVDITFDSDEWEESSPVRKPQESHLDPLCGLCSCTWLINKTLRDAARESKKQKRQAPPGTSDVIPPLQFVGPSFNHHPDAARLSVSPSFQNFNSSRMSTSLPMGLIGDPNNPQGASANFSPHQAMQLMNGGCSAAVAWNRYFSGALGDDQEIHNDAVSSYL